MALGVPHPIWVAVVLLAAMALAGLLPLTPGNFGAGAGAATLALHGTGVGLGVSLALGVAFQAVETFAGVTLGLAGAAVLAAPGTAGPPLVARRCRDGGDHGCNGARRRLGRLHLASVAAYTAI